MSGKDLSGLARIAGARNILAMAVMAGCREYANGGYRGRPIVASHFTSGNAGRYGWPPLSAGYGAWKAGATKDIQNTMRAAGRSVPRGKALPMLVLTGALRDAITAGQARVVRTGPETVTMTWDGLPDYAVYLHEGTPTMPKRSPVEPNAADRQAIIDAANRYLTQAVGTGGAVPVTTAAVPNRARVG